MAPLRNRGQLEFFKGIIGLWQSRKAQLVVPTTVLTFVLVIYGKLSWDQAVQLLQVMIPAWLGAHAWEQGKLAQAKGVVEKLTRTVHVGVPVELPPKDDGQ